ncbi:MAG TPA: hypothetical protein VH834_16325 [Solirubrobacteraceae bacterium]|jgi:hypothetical protein
MPKPEPGAWWDDVQYLRDSIERKREDEARSGLRLDARSAARAVAERAAGEAAAALMETEDTGTDPAARRGRRFERSAPDRRGRFARPERDARQREAHGEPHREPSSVADGHDTVARHAAAPLPVPRRRRTVEITGRTVGAPTLPRLVEIDRRRPARRPVERIGPRPDRLALWAVVLGVFLIFVAVTSTSHAATRAQSAHAAAKHAAAHQVFKAHTAALRATPPAR